MVRHYEDGKWILSYWPHTDKCEWTIRISPFMKNRRYFTERDAPSYYRLQMRAILMKLGVV